MGQPENTETHLELEEETSSTDSQAHAEAIHFLDPFIVLTKRKYFILKFTLPLAILTVIVTLLLPAIYTANTQIMPPQQSQSIAAAMVGQLVPFAGVASRDLGLRSTSDIYVTMLRSRTIADNLIDRFSLLSVYRNKRRVDARAHLESVSEINAGKDGVISISVSDHDPRRAADIANAYVDELQRLTQSLAVTEAGRRRIVFEQQMHNASDDLARAEQALKQTEERTGIIQLDSQSKAMIESLATLRAQTVAKEAEVQVMHSFATGQNPDLIHAEQQLAAMRSELARMEGALGGASLADIPLRKVPEAGLEYIRKVREVKYQESLLELLTKQYEAARIDEAKDASIVQVLDKAIPPEVRSWPHRSVLVLAVTFLALLFAIALVFLQEAAEHAKGEAQFSARLQLLKFYLSKGPKS